MKKFFKWLLVLLIALTLSIVIVLFNPRLIKGPVERYLSDVAGYTISLNGELEIQTGRLIEVSARNVHISGPDWATQEDLIAIGRLNLVLNTASVFKDIVLLETVHVDDLQFNLETDKEGKGNWITANKPSPPSESDGDGAIVVFNDIQVRNAAIRFRNGKTDVENVFTIDSLSHQQQADGMLHTTLNGDLNDRLVEYTHTVGPYVNILDGREISYQANGHFGELVLKGNAYIDDLLEPESPSFNLDLQGPDTREVTAMFGLDDLGAGAFSLRTSGAQAGDRYEADINGTIGDISLSASAQTSDIEEFNQLDMDVAINGPSLGALTRIFGLKNWPDKPFSLNGQAERIGQTLNVRNLKLNIGGTKLLLDALLTEFPTLESSRIKLVISGDEVEQFHELLGYQGLATGPFNVDGNLDVSPDGVELLKVSLDTSLGSATISGTLGAAPSYTGSRFNVHLDGSNANAVISGFGIDILPEKPFNMNTRFEVVENGLMLERGVLVTIEDQRLELGGLISFKPGAQGTDLEMKLSGEHFASVVKKHIGDMEVPDSPYELSGHIQVEKEGILLEDVVFGYEGIDLKTGGLIKLEEQLAGTALNFQINGKNLSSLKKFQAIGESLDMLVPGQPYQAAGQFLIEKNRLRLDGIKGRIGQTMLDVDAVVSKQADLSGSSIRFSANGPDINSLFTWNGEAGLPVGKFESGARVMLSENILSINDFSFETLKAQGKVDLELGWPYSSRNNIKFNVSIQGDDIRNFLPKLDSFEAEKASFELIAEGHKQGDQVDVRRFDSNIGNLQVSLAGLMDNNPDGDQVGITFTVLSQDLSKIGRLNGDPLPTLPLDIKAELKGGARDFVVRNMTGSLGESRLNAELEVNLEGDKPDIKLAATSDLIDLRPFLKPRESEPDEGADETTKPDRLIPVTPVPMEAFSSVDLDISLDIAELRYLQDSVTELLFRVKQQHGALDVQQLSYKGPRGKVMAALSITPIQASVANVKIDLNAEGFIFNLAGVPDDKLDQTPLFDIDFHASGNGANLQDVAGSLNGSFYMASKGGNAENVDLSILETFIFDQIFSVLMPKSDKTLNAQFSCIAARAEIENGLVTTSPAIAFTTDKIAVNTKGTIDLKTEKMNFNFNSTPTNALKINAGELFHPFILISGTLADPKVGVDPGKSVLHGGAAIATLGLSVLAKGVVDRAGALNPLCDEMLNDPPKRK